MEYKLIRSDRRTLSLEITREGEILVRAPRLLPRREIERFMEQRRQWIAEHLQRQKERVEAHPEPDEAQRARLIELARQVMPQKVAYWSGVMGLSPTGITITGARTRFGSCSGKNSLAFSWRLMQYPEECVDYVVVHELAHIREKNHSPRFYSLVERYLPDYRNSLRLLRR